MFLKWRGEKKVNKRREHWWRATENFPKNQLKVRSEIPEVF